MPHKDNGWVDYTPSTPGWATMTIKADQYTAGNNGVSLSQTPTQNNFWPLHANDLRAVYGVDNTGRRDSCVVLSPTSSLFNLGASFIDQFGNVYTVTGLRHERFRTRNLK
jgi:hypothetical protein